MTRVMIDTTEAGFSAALPVIQALDTRDIVGLYDTGSPTIKSTEWMLGKLNKDLDVVMIDQGFTGSPNLTANVRDCENGAWTVARAVDKTGWNVPRPTLYLGFPNSAQEAFNAGWRGDVWLVMASDKPPVQPPTVPQGLNVVAVQWDFSNPAFDKSVVFDPTWPEAKLTTPTPPNPTPPTKFAITVPPPGEWSGTVVTIGRGPEGSKLWVTTSDDGKVWTTPQEIATVLRPKRNQFH